MTDLWTNAERQALIDLLRAARLEPRPDYYQPDAYVADRIIAALYAPPPPHIEALRQP